jgi:cytochrome b6-f complex iron-sulfur subunit
MKDKKSARAHVPKARSDEKGGERRVFLRKLWVVTGIIAGLEAITATAAFLFSGKRREPSAGPRQLVEAGRADSFKPGSVTPFRGGRFYLARLEDGGYIALSLRCTHLGCSINWEEDHKRFVCPCHASAFDMNGSVRNSPAPRALDYYPVIIENGVVRVDVGSKRERDRFDQRQVVYS